MRFMMSDASRALRQAAADAIEARAWREQGAVADMVIPEPTAWEPDSDGGARVYFSDDTSVRISRDDLESVAEEEAQ